MLWWRRSTNRCCTVKKPRSILVHRVCPSGSVTATTAQRQRAVSRHATQRGAPAGAGPLMKPAAWFGPPIPETVSSIDDPYIPIILSNIVYISNDDRRKSLSSVKSRHDDRDRDAMRFIAAPRLGHLSRAHGPRRALLQAASCCQCVLDLRRWHCPRLAGCHAAGPS